MANSKIREIPGQDYESDYYVMRKPPLVIFLAQDHPIGTTENAKLKAKVTNEESKLFNVDVDIDMKLLDEFFREQCQKPPIVMRLVNRSHDEIRKRFAKIEGSNYDAFFFIFLSYLCTTERGKQGKLPCIKVECLDSAVPIEEFMNMIKGRPDMALKPKIFLFQADDRDLLKPWIIKKGKPEDVVFRSVKVPTDADQLMLLSTLPQDLPSLKKSFSEAVPTASEAGGVVSQPSGSDEKVVVKQEPSLLIRAFVEVLKANKDTDVLCCTPLINGKVDEMIASLDLEDYRAEKVQKLQVPLVYSTLTKKIKFYGERDFPLGL
ncbi:uncharacterized protein LOC127847852 isoform X2 [Dreissena polymorpha]|uniref:Peptidase C14 caspase domain-containing protein n=2 Tax=Dreissena polymorpha TaxID=45954 RepID=A0A9D4I2I5_DREPO|nr:uncharacterized protein LOC127847852 isoform X2 [Dreissena polymorpha]KAH3747926.1 hypothetical protein DPMN_182361 [Dreissena polymorpha]